MVAAPEVPAQQVTLDLAKNYYRTGRELYEQGDLEGAAKSLEQVEHRRLLGWQGISSGRSIQQGAGQP